jgi:hypothetical protein
LAVDKFRVTRLSERLKIVVTKRCNPRPRRMVMNDTLVAEISARVINVHRRD